MRFSKLPMLLLPFLVACSATSRIDVEPTAIAQKGGIPLASNQEKVLVGYALDWMVPAEQLDKLTHLIVFSIQVNDDGELADSTLTPEYKKMVAEARKANVAPLVSIGGWGRSGGFSAVVADPARRAKFVENIIIFLDEGGFAGVDLDWEYPKPEEMENYALLAEEIKSALGPDKWLTSAIGLGHQPAEFSPRFFKAVDLVMLMSYDWGWMPENEPVSEPHAPDSLLNFLTQWEEHTPKSKLVFGIPFYARSNSNWGDWKSWAQIAEESEPADEINEVDGFNFNGPASARHKVSYTLNNCYRGVMIWQLGHDLGADDKRSMLNVIREEWERSFCKE